MLKSKNKIFALLVFSPLLIGGIIFAQSSITIPQARLALLNERIGFANTVTGGANGFLCTVTNLQNSGTGSLRDCATKGNRWVVFNVSGKITTGGLEVAGNTTIDGRGADITIDGTLKLINSNIIVENIAINNFVGNAQEDAIEIHGTYPEEGPDNIWIDHVDFVRTPDELLVLWSHKTSTTAPRRVTVTWSHFQDNMSSSSTQGSTHGLLIGSEPKGTRSAPTKLTSAYNLFETGSRQPTIGDSSQAHLFNNLHYRYIYGVGTKRNAKMLIENEIFDARVTPNTHKAFAYGFDSDIGEQSLKETGLWLLNGATGQDINPENIFTVPYSYSLLPANQQLYDLVLSKAGKLPANAYSENSTFTPVTSIPQGRLDLLNEREGFGNTVTGGANGTLCTVTNLNNSGSGSLRECATAGNKWVVFNVNGTITLNSEINIASNTTIDGREADITITNRGLEIQNVSNVIIENIKIISVGGDDSIGIGQGANNFWIDHVTIKDTQDGFIDIVSPGPNGTKGTVSWSLFEPGGKYYSKLTMIVGGTWVSPEGYGPKYNDKMLVTLHHNFYDYTDQRHPSAGGARVHSYNNVMGWGLYGINAKAQLYDSKNNIIPEETRYGQVYSEGDMFLGSSNPSGSWSGRPKSENGMVYTGSAGGGYGKVVNPWFLTSNVRADERFPERVFNPNNYYSYNADTANQTLRNQVEANAGWRPSSSFSNLNNTFSSSTPPPTTIPTIPSTPTGGGSTSQSSSPITQTCDAQSDPLCIPLGYDNCNPFFDFECEAITCSAQPTCAPQVIPCNGTSVFQCEGSDNACGGSIIRATKRYSCENTYETNEIGTDAEGCTIWSSCDLVEQKVLSGPTYDFQLTYPSCGDYKRCTESGSTDAAGWSEAAACECSGSCYPAPDIKDVGDETLLPKNVFDGSDKVKLPVNLGWEDNAQTLVENTDSAYFCPIGSYSYEVTGNGETVTSIEDGDLESIVESCKLLLDEEYKWKVQACLDSSGEDCGAWSDEGSFQSSTAPELKLPFDIDFEGNESGVAPFPVTLEWCSDLKANSYKINAYEVLSLDPLVKKQILQTGTLGSTKYSDSSLLGGLNQLRKGATYVWEISSCQNNNLGSCGIFSQLWSLMPGGELSSTLLLAPPSGTFVNMEDTLRWRDIVFATHFLIDIKELPSSLYTRSSEYSFRSFWNNLSLNTQYTWRVASCGGSPTSRNIEDCKREDGSISWSEERTFITTGATPTNLNATPTENEKTSIPFTLNWNGKGAASYVYEVLQNGSIIAGGRTENSNIKIQYKDLPQGLVDKNTTYSWRVKTCANNEGTVCGGWATSSLTTSSLTPPTINFPKTNVTETLRTIHLAWSEIFGGNFYENELTYASLTSPLLDIPETSSYCSGNIGSVINETRSTASINKDLRCTGQYNVRVRACSDQECTLAGDWSSSVSFTVIEPPVPKGLYGLVPCGLGINNPNSPWDERESCGFGHIILLIRNLIDFALWKLAITIIVLMTVVTAVTIFFSVGGKDLLAQIKSMWRAVGIGVLILLFAWTLLNLLLGLLGFNVGIFGNWYEIKL